MTDRVQPGAIDSIIRNDELAQVFGQFSEGWIKPGTEPPSTAAIRRPEIDETTLNGFALVSTSGFDITIDAGEGFVSGWCARDSQTTITAPGGSTSTVVLAWSLDAIFDPNQNQNQNRDLADEVRVDLARNVDVQYPRTELFDVTTDSGGVVSTTDRRRLGPTVVADNIEAINSITDPSGDTVTSLSAPVRVTEEASTFTESDITLSNTNTVVSNGSVVFGQQNTVNAEINDFFGASSNGFGIQINPNTNISGFEIEVGAKTSGASIAFLVDTSLGPETIIEQTTGSFSTGDVIAFSSTLDSGTNYNIGLYNDGDDWDVGVNNDSDATPVSGTDIDITNGVKAAHPDDGFSVSTTTDAFAIESVITTTTTTSATSGDALVSFDSGVPSDIISYDLATFQRTLNNGSITIDVEDSNGNVLFSDISQNFDISGVNSSKDVQLRANLSRSSTADNPTVDFLARRFTR
jgi:hypothetical protein